MVGGRKFMSRLFVLVGDDSSGKDMCIEAINKLGKLHAQTVKKFTTRNEKPNEFDNMVFKNIIDKEKSSENNIVYKQNPQFTLDNCDITYARKGNIYGINTSEIWDGLKQGLFQIVSITNVEAIEKLKRVFGGFMVLIFINSPESKSENNEAFNIFLNNYIKFKHVLIFDGKLENLYDQIFRLFKAYENKLIKE